MKPYTEDERQRRLRAAFEHCRVRHYEAWRMLAQCDKPRVKRDLFVNCAKSGSLWDTGVRCVGTEEPVVTWQSARADNGDKEHNR